MRAKKISIYGKSPKIRGHKASFNLVAEILKYYSNMEICMGSQGHPEFNEPDPPMSPAKRRVGSRNFDRGGG